MRAKWKSKHEDEVKVQCEYWRRVARVSGIIVNLRRPPLEKRFP